MHWLHRVLALLAAVACALATAAPASLPPLSGELSGGLTTAWLPGAPPVTWKLNVAAGATAAERVALLELTAEGLRANVELRFTNTNEANWRLIESEIDVGRWLPIAARKYAPQLTGFVVTGRAVVTGEGAWREGKLSGQARFELGDATVRDAANTWSVSGVTLTGGFRALPAFVTDGALKIAFAEATIAGVVAHRGEIEFSIDAEQRVHVARARAGLMDGSVEITPFDFDPRKPEVLTDVHFEHIELKRFASSLPSLLSDARGPVSGKVAVSWSPEGGLKSAVGSLRPDAQAPVLIALTPAPGLLTGKIPPRISGFLPSWLGPLRQLFPAKTPAYETLREIENGETRLEVTTIELMVQPEGGPNGRSAQIIVNAGPAKHATAVKSVRFEINVTGPLADFVKLLLEGNVKLHLR